jgi:hypothetical protein
MKKKFKYEMGRGKFCHYLWIYFFRDRAGSGDGHGLDAYPKKDRKKMLKKIQLYEEAFKNKFF